MKKNDTSDNANAIDVAIQAIEKMCGKGSIFYNQNLISNIERIPTGCYSLDLALGGGWPRGRIIEIYGPPSSGKTTIALQTLSNLQKLGFKAGALIDLEHAFDPEYATALGIDVSKLLLSQPNNGEQALDIVEILERSNAVDVIVVDSVSALVPKAELEGSVGDSHVGRQARLMSQAMRRLTGLTARSNCILIFINQIRMKVGVMFGSPETTSGGNALKFYSSVRVDVRRTGSIKHDNEVLANTTKVKVVKNKTFPPFKQAEFNIVFGKGIDIESDFIMAAVSQGVIDKSGAWYSYQGERLGQGLAKTGHFLHQNAELFDTIKKKLK